MYTPHRVLQMSDSQETEAWEGEYPRVRRKLLGVMDVVIPVLVLVSPVCS